ncbi:MAG: cation:proton antiporter [Solirubrobacteraceae bacterium]
MTGTPFAIELGLRFGDPFALALLGFGIALFVAIGALSHQRERAFSASLLYLLLGVAAAGLLSILKIEPIDPLRAPAVLQRVAEFALVIAVFATGLRLEGDLRWRTWRSVAVLICLVMPLSIAAVALFGVTVMNLSLGAALILGAVLAPTDPVLAGDVGVGSPGEVDLQGEPRFSLSAEAGLNDGLASPFVLLGIVVAQGDFGDRLGGFLAVDVLYGVVGALVLGGLGGYLIGAAALRLSERQLLDERLDLYVAVPAALSLYGLAEVAGTYGLVAVFAAGVAFRRYESGHEFNQHVHTGGEVVEKFGELAVILLFGSLVTLSGLGAPGLTGWLLAPALLFVIRPGLVGALLVGSGLSLPQRAFLAWFGVRGVAALYYVSLVIAAGVLDRSEAATLFWTTTACVMASIVLHGLTATAISDRLLSRDRGSR